MLIVSLLDFGFRPSDGDTDNTQASSRDRERRVMTQKSDALKSRVEEMLTFREEVRYRKEFFGRCIWKFVYNMQRVYTKKLEWKRCDFCFGQLLVSLCYRFLLRWNKTAHFNTQVSGSNLWKMILDLSLAMCIDCDSAENELNFQSIVTVFQQNLKKWKFYKTQYFKY